MSITGNIILVDNCSKILSGANLNVSIEIVNQHQIFIKEIYLMLEGQVQVRWEDLNSKNKDGQIIYFMQHFEGQETLTNQQKLIENIGILSAGRHIYKMVFSVPQQIPETFAGKCGSIKYELSLMMDDMSGKRKLFTLPLQIQRSSNILTSELLLPLRAVHNKYFCWPPCSSNPIITTLTLSSASYIPGDIVKYSLIIENFTKYFNVRRINTFITQTQQYTAVKPKHKVKQDHCNLYYKTHCLAGNISAKRCIEGTFQLSKSLRTTSLDPCLVRTSYKFQVFIIMSGLHTDGYIAVPLVIRSHCASDTIANYVSNEIRLQMEELPPPEYDTLDHSNYISIQTNEVVETIV